MQETGPAPIVRPQALQGRICEVELRLAILIIPALAFLLSFAGPGHANEGSFSDTDLQKYQPSPPPVVSDSANAGSLFDDVNRYTMEDLTEEEKQEYKQHMEAHFTNVLGGTENFRIDEMIGHRRGPYNTFVVRYREYLGGMRWSGREDILVYFQGDTVVHSDLKPHLGKYNRPPHLRPPLDKSSR